MTVAKFIVQVKKVKDLLSFQSWLSQKIWDSHPTSKTIYIGFFTVMWCNIKGHAVFQMKCWAEVLSTLSDACKIIHGNS